MNNLTETLEEIRRSMLAQHTANLERRDRVLQHPDLAERLTKPPLDYARPDQWNGYVPPHIWGETINTSPARQALIEIAAEALKRDQAERPPAREREPGGQPHD